MSDFEDEIKAELDALSDSSLQDVDDDLPINFYENEEIKEETRSEDNQDWILLFLEKTSAQSKKTEDILFNAEEVLKEVEENVTRCHSRLSTVNDKELIEVENVAIVDENETSITEELRSFVEESEDLLIEPTTSRTSVLDEEVLDHCLDAGNQNSVDNFNEMNQRETLDHNEEKNEVFDFKQQKIESDRRMKEFQASFYEEVALRMDDIESERVASHQHLTALEEAESKILSELKKQQKFFEEQRTNEAATLIQRHFRGYQSRRMYAGILHDRLTKLRVKQREQRIREIEERRMAERQVEQPTSNSDHFKNKIKLQDDPENIPMVTDDVTVACNDVTMDSDPSKPRESDHKTETHVIATREDADDGSTAKEPNLNLKLSKQDVHQSGSLTLDAGDKLKESKLEQSDSGGKKDPILSLNESPLKRTSGEKDHRPHCEGGLLQMIAQDVAVLEKSVSFSKNSKINQRGSEKFSSARIQEKAQESVVTGHEGNSCQVGQQVGLIQNTLDHDLSILESSVQLSPPKALGSQSSLTQADHSILSDSIACGSPLPGKVRTEWRKEIKNETSFITEKEKELGSSFQQKDLSVSHLRRPSSENPPEPATSLSTGGNDPDESHPGKHGVQASVPCSSSAIKVVNKDYQENNEMWKKRPDDNEELLTELSDSPPIKAHDDEVEVIVCKETSEPIPEETEDVFTLDSNQTSSIPGRILNEDTSQDNVVMIHPYIVEAEHKEQAVLLEDTKPKSSAPSSHDDSLKSISLGSFLTQTDNSSDVPSVAVQPVVAHDGDCNMTQPSEDDGITSMQGDVEEDVALDDHKIFTDNIDEENVRSPINSHHHPISSLVESEIIAEDSWKKVPQDRSKHECPDIAVMWETWRNKCQRWQDARSEVVAKPHLRRTIRKSSAAKRMPPITEDEIVNGKWPHYRELPEVRDLHTLSRLFLSNLSQSGRNLTQIQRCANLTHLTLLSCGLVSLEGLQSCPTLKHINVSNNRISVMSCDGMKRLETLVAVSNSLTSIHGLDRCRELQLIDLSRNNITKVQGLESACSLSHIRLSDNQLLSISGLSAVSSLLTLDISRNNLSSLDGIENCALIRSIVASNNCFDEIPLQSLRNAVLLAHLDLSQNSIKALKLSLTVWLPSLIELDLHQNQINLENLNFDPSTAPSLMRLNLNQNLVSDFELLCKGLESFSSFSELSLSENLLTKDQEMRAHELAKSCGFDVLFWDLNDTRLRSSNPQLEVMKQFFALPFTRCASLQVSHGSEELKKLGTHLNKYLELVSAEKEDARSLSGWKVKNKIDEDFEILVMPPDIFAYHCDYLKKHLAIAAKHRQFLESKQLDWSPQSENKVVVELIDLNTSTGVIEKSSLMEEKSHNKQDLLSQDKNSPSSEKIFLESSFGELPQDSTMAPDKKGVDQVKLKPELDDNDGDAYSDVTKKPGMMPKVNPQKEILDIEHDSADAKINYPIMDEQQRSALLIQSTWKGYKVRRDIKKAFNSFDDSNEDEDFQEVDLSELNFDEDGFEQRWAFRSNFARDITPQPLRVPSSSSRIDAMSRSSSQHQLSLHHSEPGDFNSQNLYKNIGAYSKPPLPPITPSGSSRSFNEGDFDKFDSESFATLDTFSSRHSQREETLSNEWGFRNKSVAELMLKRAKKFKGRKRKEVNADEKLKKFQDMTQRTAQPLMTRRKPVQQQTRVGYFKARERSFEVQDKIPSEEDERKLRYTYEWLHNGASCPDAGSARSRDHHSAQNRAKRPPSDGNSGFLPQIAQSASHSGRMEVLSVSSLGSSRSRSKQRLIDIAHRHGEYDVLGARR
ncbi:uncharacterized protein LOC143464800 isoform X1 [Clavelina lepadiformis]|uniref:uncharacterized protein LOC143464800 isoform X1 n=1 Tax=Clavelina lepadiformis TaxID=159417 RepID=UPI00404148E5